MPFLQGASEISAILSGTDGEVVFEKLQRFMTERATTAVLSALPTVSSMGATIERRLDPYASNTMLPAGDLAGVPITELPPFMQGFYTALQKAKARNPLFSDDVPPSLNLWGEKRTQGSGANYEMWSPIRIQNSKYSAVDREMMRLGDGIMMPSKKINGVLLNAEQYNYMIEAMNKKVPGQRTFLEEMKATIFSPAYKDIELDEDKLTVLRNIAESYKLVGRDAVLMEYPSLRERVLKRQ